MTFDPGQLLSRKSSTPSVVSNANGTPSPVVGEGSLSLSTSLHLDSNILTKKVIDTLLELKRAKSHKTIQFPPPDFDRVETTDRFLLMTSRHSTAISHQKKMIRCLHAVKIRRRKLNRFMRFCPLQLQYRTNHLLRKSFRRHRAYISAPERKNRGKPRVQYETDLKAKGKYPINDYISLSRLSESRVHYMKQLADIFVPNSVTEALADPKWKEAMNEEMRALQKNVTWELVPLPHGKKTVGCRWIYTVKLKADGSVERYKARLVAKGYTQRYEIDYEETFAPVAKINTIRVLLSLAANLDWPLHQFDVKNAFLHGDLEEEVYMDLPLGCNSAHDKKNQSNSDHTLFLKRDEGELTALIVYVDDIIYVMDLLTETGMLGCKPADTPIEINHKLCEDMDQEPTNKEQYQRLVGRLIYLAHTKPDIAYVVSVVSQFMHSPSVFHRNAVDRILRYLKSAHGEGLMFSKNGDLEVVGYTDVDWADSITDKRSTFGYFTFVGGNLVTWRSKKQNVVSRSSAEAEYRGMAHGVCELLWIRRLLTELGFKPEKPLELHCDNKPAIDIAHNPVQHD
ncbi:unnamed protein product [Prunus armeniaca]